MVRARILIVSASLVAAIGSTAYWLMHPPVYNVAVPSEWKSHLTQIEKWQRYLEQQKASLRITITRVPDSETAAKGVRDRRFDLGIIRVDHQTPYELRSLAILERKPILISPGTTPQGNTDATYVGEQMARLGGRPNIMLADGPGALIPGTHRAPEGLERLKARLPFLVSTSVEQRAKSGTGIETLETLALTKQFVAREDLSKSDGAEVARWIMNGWGELGIADIPADFFPQHESDEGLRAHDGVAAFKTREVSPFLERNSDLIYIGLAALGTIASLIGAAMANIRSKLRDGGLRYIGRMEILAKELREANSPERVYRIADTALELAQNFAKEIAAHKVERRIDSSFQTLYTAFRAEVAFKLDRGAKPVQSPEIRAKQTTVQ